MAGTLTVKKVNGNAKFQHVVLDVLAERIYMNDGVALFPFMSTEYYFVRIKNESSGFNGVEPNYVEFFHRIRKANREAKKGDQKKKWIEPNFFSNRPPGQLGIVERIFIGGKIFPVMMLIYNNEFVGLVRKSADAGKISIKKVNLNTSVGKFISGSTRYDEFDNRYISIDNDKISIMLPKITEMGIDYVNLLYDFLTNGNKTMIAATHGEFPNMAMYELATDKKSLQNGCWLTKDRKEGKYGNLTFQFACNYIIEKKLQGVIAPFEQIYTFYEFVDQALPRFKHKCRWTKGAKKLVKALTMLEGGSSVIYNDIETILSELNLGICDYAITQFYELFNGKYATEPLDTLEKAYQFDKQFINYEQGTVAVPIYNKTSKATIQRYQDMADQDAKGQHGTGSWFMDKIVQDKVIPEFDDPWNASVKDAGFRIDLPLLMLWLDRHKPTSAPFKGKVDANGYLKEEYKKIIRTYEIK